MTNAMPVTFTEIHRDESSHARIGKLTTPHGEIQTPVFMPVGTKASVKGLTPDMVESLGSQIILANTYHLMLRPGSELIDSMSGLHPWMRWDKPILTDSGGFQVFSLSDINKITEDGVIFKSHIDGAQINLTPERSMQVQNELGADIIMAFDDCPPASDDFKTDNAVPVTSGRDRINSAEYLQRVQTACERSVRWLDRCVKAHDRSDRQALFGIIQGGTDLDQRTWCTQRILEFDLPGYAIGGVAVGEGYEGLKKVVQHTAPLMPTDKPRYLMGVGYERDIVTAVRAGVDMFDCVLPTRNGRNAFAFTPRGAIKLRNAKFAKDSSPIDESCDCPACTRGYSRSYLRHLFMAGEMLGPILVSMHNIRHFHRLMDDIRVAIRQNAWGAFHENWPIVELA